MAQHLHRPFFRRHEHFSDTDHDHAHDYKSADKRRLMISIIVTGVVMIVEVIGGIVSNSIALIGDAGHMFTHMFALSISYVAIRLTAMKPCHHRTFGMFRAEVLGSFVNGLFLMVVTGAILFESMKRLFDPEPVQSREMFIVAVIGLAVNIVTILILEGSHKEDRNIRAAFMHMVADALSSVAVVIGAVVIHFTGFLLIDPLIGILIAILIVTWAWDVIKDSGRVLLEMTPKGTDTDMITKAVVEADDKIRGIVDMHVVEITNGMYDFSAHVVYDCKTLEEVAALSEKIRDVLAHKFNINHATIEPVIEGGTVLSGDVCGEVNRGKQ